MNFDRFRDRRHSGGRRAADDERGVIYRTRHRLAVAVARNPVLIGMGLAMVVATVALSLVLGSQSSIRDTQDRQQAQQTQIVSLTGMQAKQRAEVTEQFCRQLNTNARASNRNTEALNRLILQSVKQSRTSEKVYRQLGLPPYKERLRQAQAIVRRFRKQKVPILDCKAIVRKLNVRPKGRLAGHPH